MKQWYALSDEDIRTVADDLEVKLNKRQIKKVREIAPEYIDWFAAIELAINVTLQKTEDSE